MSLEEQKKPNKPKMNRPGMTRRNFIKSAAVGAGLAVAGGAAMGLKHMLVEHYEDLLAEDNIDKQNTHRGTARILKKIEKQGNEAPTAAETALGAMQGYNISGLSGALMMGGPKGIAGLMGDDRSYYLVIKIDDREPIVQRVVPVEYKNTKVGDAVPVEYVTDDKTQNIKRINLNPR